MKIKFLKAGNGDSFLLTIGQGKATRNILIDGGIDKTYYDESIAQDGDLLKIITEIKKKEQFIDLLILTHIDNDHICGLLEWFEKDKEATDLIKTIWFNSGKKIAEHFKEEENEDLNIELKIFRDAKTGVREAIQFETFLEGKGIWDGRIIKQGQKYNQSGISIHILSPNEDQLYKLLKEYRRVLGKDAYTAHKEKDWNRNICDFITEEDDPKWRFSQDYSPKNGSSISFLLSYEERDYLFLADSHPKPIVEYLESIGHSKEDPSELELFKVSHHGSKANTNKEIIQLFKAKKYFISTDGTSDNHPNKRTLSRIVEVNKNANFYFNYQHIRNELISEKDFSDYGLSAFVRNEICFCHES